MDSRSGNKKSRVHSRAGFARNHKNILCRESVHKTLKLKMRMIFMTWNSHTKRFTLFKKGKTPILKYLALTDGGGRNKLKVRQFQKFSIIQWPKWCGLFATRHAGKRMIRHMEIHLTPNGMIKPGEKNEVSSTSIKHHTKQRQLYLGRPRTRGVSVLITNDHLIHWQRAEHVSPPDLIKCQGLPDEGASAYLNYITLDLWGN